MNEVTDLFAAWLPHLCAFYEETLDKEHLTYVEIYLISSEAV